jgi:hypothetical protein
VGYTDLQNDCLSDQRNRVIAIVNGRRERKHRNGRETPMEHREYLDNPEIRIVVSLNLDEDKTGRRYDLRLRHNHVECKEIR